MEDKQLLLNKIAKHKVHGSGRVVVVVVLLFCIHTTSKHNLFIDDIQYSTPPISDKHFKLLQSSTVVFVLKK